ncbi:MAG: hypothetical protein WCH01_12260 [Methylococcaceae bacterium]
MNLDDLVLLRGWINQIEWTELDSQLPEAGASSRKHIKDLRRQLAMKARFYGKPELVELWLGERGHTETWERLLLWAVLAGGKAISSLNTDDCRAYILRAVIISAFYIPESLVYKSFVDGI